MKVYDKDKWIDISTPPEEGQFCMFWYKWSMHSKDDRSGMCEGWYHEDKIQWLNMPCDIGKKTVIKWQPAEGSGRRR